ncbi:MAG: heme lyase CcmF/NrfE family subunit [bacterium]|nr:MAG: heme lyase CcmF/NrfE family subunit [bacterium]
MTAMGSSALLVAFPVAVYGAAVSAAGGIRKRNDLVRSAEAAVYVNFLLLTAGSLALLSAFLVRDFSVKYVYEYSSLSLSTAYSMTAFWAGQEGSLLLWMWLLSLFSALTVYRNRNRNRHLMPWVNHVLMVNGVFFLVILNFVTNPFTVLPGPPPADGYGLNPLLQNPWMIWHPPALFIGYVGLTVPFAFALATLLAGGDSDLWIRRTRLWTVISWFFLGVGILLGAEWAYVELGWGGFWAWDPVENASLMPWLTATAFLHSAMIQERRGMMRRWNLSLVVVTYLLVLFGTFITRSGIISSVHAFGKSNLGAFFLCFMFVTLGFSSTLLLRNWNTLQPERPLESTLSRESGFLYNNLVLTALAVAVLWGTVLPVMTELVTGNKVAVGRAFYDRVSVPIGILLLALMGLCPLLGWKRTSLSGLKRNLRTPLLAGTLAGLFLWAEGVRHGGALFAMALSAVVVTVILQEFSRGVAARGRAFGEGRGISLVRLVLTNRRRYGGYIIHAGIALMIVGMSGAPMTREVSATLRPNDSMKVGDFTLQYRHLRWIPSTDQLAVTARLTVSKRGRPVGSLVPERRFYSGREDQPTNEVSILSTWKEDLYVILTGYYKDGRASFRVLVNPLIAWLWAGGAVVTSGTLLAIWPGRRKDRSIGQADGGPL